MRNAPRHPASRWFLLFGLLIAGKAFGQFDFNAPEPPSSIDGTLFLHGGGTVDLEMRKKFLEFAGGENAKIVVIPTADVKDPLNPRKLDVWREAGAKDTVRLHAATREDASRPELVELLDRATGVWFSGGKQTQLIDIYAETPVEAAIRRLINRGGVVGGTSAGAAVASKVMLVYEEIREGFGFLPGTIVDQHFLAKNRTERLKKAVDSHPGHVGLGIDERTALIVRGRRLEVFGASTVTLYLSPSKNRASRLETFASGAQADLIALCRAAADRALDKPFPSDQSLPTQLADGTLIIAGGGSLSRKILEAFVDYAGGIDSKIVYIPCSEQPVIDNEPAMVETLRRSGSPSVQWIHTKDRRLADDSAFYKPLTEATGIWLGGGRQWNLVDSYQNTETHRLMHQVLARGGVIGGSSAGASIQGDYMPRGNPLGNRDIMSEGYERGLGFLTGVAIDQHFTQRRRLPDMIELKQTYPQLLGIGIDEKTAIVVQNRQATVIGEGCVFFFNRRRANEASQFARLRAGESFDLSE